MHKKILFINCSDSGSTGTIIRDIAFLLKQKGWDSFLCVPRVTLDCTIFRDVYETSLKYEQSVYYRVSKFLSNPLGFAPRSTSRIKKVIETVKPDIIHVHCINSYMCDVYSLLEFIKESGIPTVITNHAEFYYTGSCAHSNDCNQWIEGCVSCSQLRKPSLAKNYWERMKKIFSGFDNCIVTSVSPWVMHRSCASGIMKGIPQVVIENGVDTSVFKPQNSISLRDALGISPITKIILHVTALYSTAPGHSKGGAFIRDLAYRFRNDNVLFLVIGNHYEKVSPSNIILCGRVSSREELARYYSLADVTVLTSIRETYCMPLAESLCCGTPVVGFNAGGPESIALPKYTSFCSYGNVDELEKRLRNDGLFMKDCWGSQISTDASKRYNRHNMSDNYLMVYNHLLEL